MPVDPLIATDNEYVSIEQRLSSIENMINIFEQRFKSIDESLKILSQSIHDRISRDEDVIYNMKKDIDMLRQIT